MALHHLFMINCDTGQQHRYRFSRFLVAMVQDSGTSDRFREASLPFSADFGRDGSGPLYIRPADYIVLTLADFCNEQFK